MKLMCGTSRIMRNIIIGILYTYVFAFFKFSLNKNGINLALFYSLLFSLTNVL